MRGIMRKAIVVILFLLYFTSSALATGSNPSDKQAFMDFYNEIYNATKYINEIYAPFVHAMKNRQPNEMAKIALSIKTKTHKGWVQINLIPIPSLGNNSARQKVTVGKKAISNAYRELTNDMEDRFKANDAEFNRKQAEGFIEYQDKEATAAGKSFHWKQALEGFSSLNDAAIELGINPKNLKKP